mgnify:CR=1 FL=1
MASGIYPVFKTTLMKGGINCSSSTAILVALANSAHAFNAAHTAYSEVSANCIASGNGYTTGGNALAAAAVTLSGTAAVFDASDAAWATASFTAAHAIIYMSSAGSLIASVDFGGNKIVDGGTFTIVWNTAGIITLA